MQAVAELFEAGGILFASLVWQPLGQCGDEGGR
jgi:hypothetical protein